MIRIFLSVLLGGFFLGNPSSAQTFNTVTQALFTGVGYSHAAWGDYDNDGDLDVIICGQDHLGNKHTKLYRNNLDSTFTDMLIDFTSVSYGFCAWGDYDNDGDLDVVITGADANGIKIATLYRNDGGSFVNINAGLTGVLYSSAAWGDYDNDGDLDLLITGQNTANVPSTHLYQNTNGTFSSVAHSLAPITGGNAVWGDYDNDGFLDILLSGTDHSNNKICKIYRNNKNGSFTDQLVVGLNGVSFGASAWADFDRDGDLDLAIAGTDAFNNRICKIYRNLGNNTFTDIFAATTGVAAATLAWGDYNNDGAPDLIVIGNNTSGQLTKLYLNTGTNFTDSGILFTGVYSGSLSWADFDNDNDLDLLVSGFSPGGNAVTLYRNTTTTANTPPAVPTNTAATVSEDTARLSWQPSADTQTPAAGLTYNIWVSTSKSAVDILSPSSNPADGYRTVVSSGNTGHSTSHMLRGLEQGKYYWTVQAVDNAFAGSAFAPLDSFIICRKFSLGNDTAVCFKDSLYLTAGVSGDVVNWYASSLPLLATNQLSIKPEIIADDTIWAQRSNAVSGCVTYDTIVVRVNPVSVIDQGYDTAICAKTTIQLGGAPTAKGSVLPYVYRWTPGTLVSDSTAANPVAFFPSDTTFRLIVQAGSCRPDTAYVRIVLHELPVVTASRDTFIGAGETVALWASGALVYQWSPQSGLDNSQVATPKASPLEEVEYIVVGTDQNGCQGKDSVLVTVRDDLFIPDLFSPDGNGVNETFRIFGAGIRQIDFKVYNRYGEVVFESKDIDELLRKGWDGSYKGIPQSTGTYVWTMEGTSYEGTELKYKGRKTGKVLLKR
jgi:gliding motility-associated-like protein